MTYPEELKADPVDVPPGGYVLQSCARLGVDVQFCFEGFGEYGRPGLEDASVEVLALKVHIGKTNRKKRRERSYRR